LFIDFHKYFCKSKRTQPDKKRAKELVTKITTFSKSNSFKATQEMYEDQVIIASVNFGELSKKILGNVIDENYSRIRKNSALFLVCPLT